VTIRIYLPVLLLVADELIETISLMYRAWPRKVIALFKL